MGEGFAIDNDDDSSEEVETETDIGVKIGFFSGITLIIIGLIFHSYFEKQEEGEIVELEEIEIGSVDSIQLDL